MEPRFFFTQAANVCNPEPWRGRPGIIFEGSPTYHSEESDAITAARRRYAKGDYDAVLVFGGNWNGDVIFITAKSKYSDGQLERPAGYDAAILSTVTDAEYVLKRLLAEYVSLRS